MALDAAGWTAVATAIIAIATGIAAFAAYQSAVATRRMVEAQLFTILLSEYASPEMGTALAHLSNQERSWRNDPDGRSFEQLVEEWTNRFAASSPSDDPVNNARRRVAHLFWKASAIIDEGLLTGGLRDE